MRRKSIGAPISILAIALSTLGLAALHPGCRATSERNDGSYLPDASSDSDGDIDTDQTCEHPDCLDSDLPCCEAGSCELKPSGALCDHEYRAGYSCLDEEPECGSKIYVHFKQQLCDGQSPYCQGEITDWGDWQIDRTCRPFEVCEENETDYISFEEGVQCVPDVGKCPLGFDELVCFEGGEMTDCPQSGCPDPAPALVQSVNLSDVSGGQPGEVVLLELFVSERVGYEEQDVVISPKPFTDIRGTVSHNGEAVPFYNHYAADHSYSDWFGERYRFPVQWYLPQFWGEDMSGLWEISFEDSAFSGLESQPLKFELEQWCVRFQNPELTEIENESKEWIAAYVPTMENPIGFIEEGVSYFELQIDEIYRADESAPVLNLDVDFSEPAALSIDLVAADGAVISIKEQQSESIPQWTALGELTGKWLTGRYQLKMTSSVANDDMDNRVNKWSISTEAEGAGND